MPKLALIIFACLLLAAIANASTTVASPTPTQSPPIKKTTPEKKASAGKKDKLPKEVKSLIKKDLHLGTGPQAENGKSLKVNYTGWLYDSSLPEGKGKEFDTSVGDGRKPFEFKLGAGYVIKGWDEGLEKMKAGGKRVLIIPSDLGYGARGAGDAIPPNAALIFEIELLEVN